jgi:hypothetical protein
MTDTTYAIPTAPSVVTHGWDASRLLLDGVDKREFNQTDAMAASGDYFVTLATRLDLLAQGMRRDSAEQIELENLIRTLFYLQKHYSIIAKHKLKP